MTAPMVDYKIHWLKMMSVPESRAVVGRHDGINGRDNMTFPKEHRQKLHSTNPIERLHAEVKRRTNVVGIFPNEAAITRLVGAILLEQNDEWAVSRRYMTLESIAPLSDGVPITLPTVAA